MDDPLLSQAGVERTVRANTLTIRVEGREGHDAGVPLRTFLLAMRQSVDMLEELGRELAEGPEILDWRIVEASYTNPLLVVIEGRSKNLGRRPQSIADALVLGLTALEDGKEPASFSDHSLRSVKELVHIISRDGIANCTYQVPNLPPIAPTRETARTVTKILKRRVYYEVSTLEGVLQAINIHDDKKTFGIYDLLTNEKTACVFDESMQRDVVAALGKRVSVEGTVKYNRQGLALSIDVDGFEVMPLMEDLPQFNQGERLDIAGGIPSEEYVRGLRDAE